MGLITKRLAVAGDKGTRVAAALFDTGASASVVRRDIVESVATVLRLPAAKVHTLGDGVGRLRATETAVLLHVRIRGIRLSDNFVVVKRLADQMIVGAHTMQKWWVTLDVENEELRIDRRVGRMLLA